VTSPSWWSSRTVSNHGSGFQMPGVFAFCGTDPHNMSPSAQSGCKPGKT
jgi:hypothetical protein